MKLLSTCKSIFYGSILFYWCFFYTSNIAAVPKLENPGDTSRSPVQMFSNTQLNFQAFVFYSYTKDGTEGKDFNKFDFDRMYFTVKSDIANDWKLNFTTDIYRNADTIGYIDQSKKPYSYSQGLSLRLKYAALEYTPAECVTIKFGMIPTIWPGFVDVYWKYRGVVNTITDRNKLNSTADLGVSLAYKLPMKLGEIAGFVLNGDGYMSPETNRFKELGSRLTLTPFVSSSPGLKNLTLAGYYSKGSNSNNKSQAIRKNRFGALLNYNYYFLNIGIDADKSEDASTGNPNVLNIGNAVSFFGELKEPYFSKDRLSLIMRYDVFDPNKDISGDIQRFSVIGVTYKVNDKVIFVVDHQIQKNEHLTLKRPDKSTTDHDERWFLHSIINF